MKILLINNDSKKIKLLINMLKDYEIDLIGIRDLNFTNSDDYDFIVLSGGNFARAFTRSGAYKNELELIKNSDKPIFGICLGMQLIVHAFNDYPFSQLRPKRRGVIDINLNDNRKLKVFENHKWAIDKVSKPIIEMGRSEDGVEFIKHESRPVWGVQFHPESDSEYGSSGKLIFNEFITEYNLH